MSLTFKHPVFSWTWTPNMYINSSRLLGFLGGSNLMHKLLKVSPPPPLAPHYSSGTGYQKCVKPVMGDIGGQDLEYRVLLG